MKKIWEKILVIAVAVTMAMMPVQPAFAAENDTSDDIITVEGEFSESISTEADGEEDNDKLFEEYVKRLFLPDTDNTANRKAASAGERLSGIDGAVYYILQEYAEEVAAGRQASTRFPISVSELDLAQTSWTAAELGVQSIIENGSITDEAVNAGIEKIGVNESLVHSALLSDCPYEFYWHDKVAGVAIQYSGIKASGDKLVFSDVIITFSFAVAEGYSAGEYTVNAAAVAAAQTAAANAQAIVDQYASSSDQDKLAAYKKEICDLVSYNDEAAAGGVPFGDPWQLIWVFDGDDTTNVVCEGYAKAFKYLCDMSEFESDLVSCIIVTGTMSDGIRSEAHMWNIVQLEYGDNYLADVTNCDSEGIGEPDLLFLVGYAYGSVTEGYTINCNGTEISYIYDEDEFKIHTEDELTLSGNCLHHLSKVEAKAETCTENGNIEYWICSDCGKMFSDENGQTVVEDPVIPAPGHDWGDWTVIKEPTTTEEGIESRVCRRDSSHTESRSIPKLDTEVGPCGDNVTYELDKTSGVLTIRGTGEMWDYLRNADPISPFNGNSTIKEIIIEDGVTSIGNYAFWTCSNLESITIPDSVTSIGRNAFEHCNSLGGITIPESVTSIGNNAFSDCTKLTSITIPDGVTSIANNTFSVCINLKDVTIPGSVTSIGSNAFSSCTKLTSITIPDGVKTIDTYAFSNCTKLESIIIPASVTSIGNYAFRNCEKLTIYGYSGTRAESFANANGISFVCLHHITKMDAKDPTCTEEGNTECWTCTDCRKMFTDASGETEAEDPTIPALGHDWGDWTVIKEPTCTETGIRKKICKRCEKEETESIAAKGHTEVEDAAVSPTCTEPGKTAGSHCSVCRAVIKAQETVPAAGHKYGSWVNKDEENHKHTCSVCGAEEVQYHSWGEAAVNVTGKEGDHIYTCKVCKQTKTITKWIRLAGNGRYDTMSAIVREGFHKTGGTVVVATGTGFKDALAAAGLAGLSDGPVILTDGKTLSSQAEQQLKRLKPSKVYIAGGTAAVSENVASRIKTLTGVQPERRFGQTSAGTSASLATAGKGFWSDTAIIATNKSFKDALSAAPLSYSLHMPILLADNGQSLNSDVLNALKQCGIQKVIIVGGELAVTPNVVNQLKKIGITNISRIAGQTAVDTSAQIAEYGLSHGLTINGMGVATSQNYPDALAGAALCGHNNSVLVLADDKAMKNTSFPAPYKEDFDKGYVFGGTLAVSDKVLEALTAAVKPILPQ